MNTKNMKSCQNSAKSHLNWCGRCALSLNRVIDMGRSTDSHLWLAPALSSEERVMRNMILTRKQNLLLAACFTPANDSMDYLCMMWPLLVMVAPSEDSIARKKGILPSHLRGPWYKTPPQNRGLGPDSGEPTGTTHTLSFWMHQFWLGLKKKKTGIFPRKHPRIFSISTPSHLHRIF